MKKTLTVALLVVMLIASLATVVNAVTSSELADKLYEKGSKYGMTSADKVKVERYLSEYPVTDEQADALLAKADEAVAVMEASGKTNYSELTTAEKNQLKSIAKSAAELIDVTLVFKKGSLEIYKDGKLIETVTVTDGKLAYTGNNINVVLVVSTIAIIALAIAFVSKKKFADAK